MPDLGLSYEAAVHGVQSCIRYEMTKRDIPDDGPIADFIKHLRVGVDCRAADMQGLADLLIKKGVITLDEYTEHMRLAMNDELVRYTDYMRETYNMPPSANFR